MKKYLLTALLGVFGLFGAFASAESFTFVGTLQGYDGVYSPDSITFDNDLIITQSNVVYDCDLGEDVFSCRIMFGDSCTIDYYDGGGLAIMGTNGDSCELTAGTYNVSGYGNPFSSFTINDLSSGGDDSGGDNSGGSLLPNGESDLSGIITGLNSTIVEFIPYLVYLGLGIITVIIGFVAIRWLVNRTQAKIRGTFSSGRRRK